MSMQSGREEMKEDAGLEGADGELRVSQRDISSIKWERIERLVHDWLLVSLLIIYNGRMASRVSEWDQEADEVLRMGQTG
ncbi:hypothetical protein PGTUg99_014338 [Puccinia graminis f. sp. tritici]|uniref:Uncharacterized protein n=1 Tax=Puccinia graminis f. sp. tritici TaxID=56615 RepID=A0A5B0RU18_PUCGR|nr:hypothetical protein PGTUg99_014338 [Puccinia graminis f. sp. tritici]